MLRQLHNLGSFVQVVAIVANYKAVHADLHSGTAGSAGPRGRDQRGEMPKCGTAQPTIF
jgi:hypothetical protein